MKEEKFLNIKEASIFLGLKENYLYKLTCLKEIPYIKYGRRVLFDAEELKSWRQSRMTRIPTKDELSSKAALQAASRH